MADRDAETPLTGRLSSDGAPIGAALKPAVEYSRRLYDDVLGWYRSADAKAQVVMGLDGAFLAFIAAGAFRKPEELASLFATFQPLTWRLLGLIVGSVTSVTKPLNEAGACPPERLFRLAHEWLHQVTVVSWPAPATVWSPSVNAPRLGNAKTTTSSLSDEGS